jgi:hypothetical protein
LSVVKFKCFEFIKYFRHRSRALARYQTGDFVAVFSNFF